MSVSITEILSPVSIEVNASDITVYEDKYNINISQVGQQGRQGAQGAQGATGQGVPTGGTARQALTKIDSTDYNTAFKSNWYDYAFNVEYTGAETAITAGTVYTCTIDGGTIYRFVNSTNNANGYPIEDSFYTNFDGSNLTNLITTRG